MRSAESYLAQCNTLMAGQPPRDILRRALGIIEDPRRWHHFTHDAEGSIVKATDPSAVRWDLEGAIAASCNRYGILPPYFMVLLDETLREDFGFEWGSAYYQQSHHHDAVVALLKMAIERAPEL